ncbi:hypothetical protein BKA56DRAFT_626067 [Ilyonectria sp. MPI-CAGE-AT-0026]|nr:hypothetical protein BKA56DRAFT_626067 [Ilyonectria sp. MPI-CAGE-AT-0026]
MGDIRFSPPDSSSQDGRVLSIDPYALVEAILGQKIEKQGSACFDSLQSGYDDPDMRLEPRVSSGGGNIHPDSPPKDVRVGAVNPYALVEALLSRNIDTYSTKSAQIISNVLQTDYDELFDMKHNLMLFIRLRLNEKDRKAEKLSEKDMRILNKQDLITPDLSERIGLKDLGKTHIKRAHMQNRMLYLVLHARSLGKTVSNREVTISVNKLISPFRIQKGHWTPPNSSWRNIWLIAVLFLVFWADPYTINCATRVHQEKSKKKRLSIKFHYKGGDNNTCTETVEVDYKIPINNSNNMPLYCHSSDSADIWPALYKKVFAKWITSSSSEQLDITQMHFGNPIKAMAQINSREPYYFRTKNHSAHDLLGLVRSNCINFKTINPIVA